MIAEMIVSTDFWGNNLDNNKSIIPTSYHGTKDRWMFPRAERTIENHTIWTILKAFEKYLLNKKNNIKIEDKIRKDLAKNHTMGYTIDKETGSTISHQQIKTRTGAIRTIIAEFIALGLMYREKKYNYITQAGTDILKLDYRKEKDATKIDLIITSLLLNLQYNNEYFHSSQIKMHENITVKPFCFILKLMADKRILYLSKEEMYIIYLKAKTIYDYEMIIEKIIQFRKTKNIHDIIEGQIPNVIKELSIHEILKSRGIINKIKQGFILNDDFLYIDLIKKNVIDYNEDSKSIISAKQHGTLRKERAISHEYDYNNMKKDILDLTKEFTISQIYKIISGYNIKVRSKMLNILQNEYELFESECDNNIEIIFKTPNKNYEAEKIILDIFKNKFHIESLHTGQIRNKTIRGNHSDILNIFKEQNCCGIIDSKVNAKKEYSLPIGCHDEMKRYIETYSDLLFQKKLPKNLRLSYACFISSGFSNNITSNLLELKKIAGIPICAMTIADLITVSKKNISPEHFLNVMNKGGIITSDKF